MLINISPSKLCFASSLANVLIKFSKPFSKREIVSTLSRQLSWSHFVIISAIDDKLKWDFYADMCLIQHWRDLSRINLIECHAIEFSHNMLSHNCIMLTHPPRINLFKVKSCVGAKIMKIHAQPPTDAPNIINTA